jgi:uncharacterized protein (TIGR00255 family)
VEISSVNRKQIEISLSLPRGWAELEPRLRDEIGAAVSRGRLSVAIAVHRRTGAKSAGRINTRAAVAYCAELRRLQRKLKLQGDLHLKNVLQGPGVLCEPDAAQEPQVAWPALRKALFAALQQLDAMRIREGKALAGDIAVRLRRVEMGVAAVQKRAPQVVERHRAGLLQKIKTAGLEIAQNDERLLKEIVFFADRSDISEEITRLRSHLKQFYQSLRKKEPVGRTLDFMIVEMNREVNTIGSKANDLEIAQAVVAMKTELEKIREQVQNIE